MRTIFLSFLLLFVTATTITAQSKENQNFRNFYKHHRDNDNIIGLSLPIGLANVFISSDETELKKIIKKGKKVRILVFDEVSKEIKSDLKNNLPKKIYQKFLIIKDSGSNIKILVRENNEYISEVILLIQSDDSLVTMGVYGKFTYEDLQKLANAKKEES